MSSTTQSRRGGAAAVRLLALLAAVLGLLAMHGLASTHHAAAGTPGRSGPVAGAPHDVAEPHGHENDVPATSSTGVAHAVTALPGCHDDCSEDLWVLCAAVLVAAAGAAAAVTAAVHRHRRPVAARSDVRARAPAVRWSLPTPDPVAELCISRT